MAGIPDYRNLDVSGEALAAAERMEARAREPASEELFAALVEPLLPTRAGARILEVGAGTGALGRRMAAARPRARVYVSDKSAGMLAVARTLAAESGLPNLEVAGWDVLEEAAFPFGGGGFDLIVSSVMVPYLGHEDTVSLVRRLAARLEPGGVLAFVEQDLQTDAVAGPSFELFHRVLAKEARPHKPSLALGLRPLLREAGLTLLPRASFLWTDERYGPYVREVLGRLAEDARKAGRISEAELHGWSGELEALAARGDFHYGLVYHRVAGRRA